MSRLPVRGERVNQVGRKLEFPGRYFHPVEPTDFRGVDDFIGIAQHREHEATLDAFDRNQVLLLPHHDLADTDARHLRERLLEHGVGVLATLVRQQIYG